MTPKSPRRRPPSTLVAVAFAPFFAACPTPGQHELESIAKDWNRVIRASQVIPVYPLTEDLQPGDVFLVQSTINEQQETWKKDGYLPLDNHLARLDPTYDDFYDRSFFASGSSPTLPKDWLADGGTEGPWSKAPAAAFPTYSFSVDEGAGLNLAIPISGVPVGLGLLGSRSANCTVELSDARTLGIDTISLHDDVQVWGVRKQGFLRNFAPTPDGRRTNYVRVVSRIYLIGSIDVSIRSAEAKGASLDVGAPKPVELLTLPKGGTDKAGTAESYADNVTALNDMLKTSFEALPGGSLRVTSASSRSISMRETFPRPLIVGYLGLDYPILANGVLGRPIPTHAVLTGAAPPDSYLGQLSSRARNALAVDAYEILKNLSADARAALLVADLDALATYVRTNFATYSNPRAGVQSSTFVAQPTATGYETFRGYQGQVLASLRVLEGIVGGDIPAPSGMTVDDARDLAGTCEAEVRHLAAAEEPLVSSAIAHLQYLLEL